MSLKVSVKQLEKNLPEIIDRAAAGDDVYMVERDGKNIAVIVSLSLWRRSRAIGEQLDALGGKYRLAADEQKRAEELLSRGRLTAAEEKELKELLEKADEVMLRRAEALEKS